MQSFKGRKDQQGFTILEFAIVIVIVGLIIGGVLTGRDLLRNAELNAFISQFRKYEAAHIAFKLQYDALPGDMDDASSYFSDCIDGAVSYCDGDGDGEINKAISAPAPDIREPDRVWEHLSHAKLIEGSYDGSMGPHDDSAAVGVVIPPVDGLSSGGAFSHSTSGTYNNWLIAGQWDEDGEGNWSGSIVSPEEAKVLDQKIDDGEASDGKFRAFDGTEDDSGCLDGSGDYLSTIQDVECVLAFDIAY